MSFIAVDIGNSFTKLGSVQHDRRKDFYFKFRTELLFNDYEIVEDELLLHLASIEKGFFFGIASVVPGATDALITILQRTYPDSTIHLLKNSDVPIVNKYHNPDQVGIDRLLAAFGAYHSFPNNLIVISFGTATTIDCVSRDGKFLGGIIAPGIRMGAEALADKAAQLPMIPMQFPSQILGQTTEESMQSGVMYGALVMIDGLVAKLKAEVFPGKKVMVIATGGGASKELLEKISGDEYREFLVLEGIVETTASIYGTE